MLLITVSLILGKKKRNSKRERLQDDIIGKGHRVSNRCFLMHFYIAYVVCFLCQQRRHDTRKKTDVSGTMNNQHLQSSQWEESAGQERVFRSRVGGGVSLVIHTSFSSSDRWEKAPERDDRYVSQTRCRPPASPRTLFAVKTRKRKKKSKQETDEAERNTRS